MNRGSTSGGIFNGISARARLAEAKPKIRRRPRTVVVIRPPRTKPITREEFELAVSTIEMITRQPDAGYHQTADAEIGGQTDAGTLIVN